MKITAINRGGSIISFKSGYPTFQSAGHLTFDGNRTSVYENTNPFYRQMTTNKGDNISFTGSPFNRDNHDSVSFTGSPFNRDNHDSVSFKGVPPYRHYANEGKECPPEGCQPIKLQVKVPPNGGILLHRHVDMLGNVLDIKG